MKPSIHPIRFYHVQAEPAVQSKIQALMLALNPKAASPSAFRRILVFGTANCQGQMDEAQMRALQLTGSAPDCGVLLMVSERHLATTKTDLDLHAEGFRRWDPVPIPLPPRAHWPSSSSPILCDRCKANPLNITWSNRCG